MKVHIDEKDGRPSDVDIEIVGRRVQLATIRRYFDKNDPSLHCRAIVHTRIVDLHSGMVRMSACQMGKGMKNILSNHAYCFVVFE